MFRRKKSTSERQTIKPKKSVVRRDLSTIRHVSSNILTFGFIALLAYLAATSSPQKNTRQAQEQTDGSRSATDANFQQYDPSNKFDYVIGKLIDPSFWVQLGLLYVTCRGIQLALGSLRQLRRQTNANVIAARAAKATADALKVAERAFLNTKAKDWELGISQETRKWTFSGRLTNSGKTVAVVKRIAVRYAIADALPDEPNYDAANGHTDQGSYIISPNDDPDIFNAALAAETEIPYTSLRGRPPFLYVYGRIDYLDAFGDSHHLGFGGRYTQTRDGGSFDRSKVPPNYNHAD
jgi:hypothetical protein